MYMRWFEYHLESDPNYTEIKVDFNEQTEWTHPTDFFSLGPKLLDRPNVRLGKKAREH